MKTLYEIASDVEREYQMGGLFDGIHKDFVTEVAKRYAEQAIDALIDECTVEGMCENKSFGRLKTSMERFKNQLK